MWSRSNSPKYLFCEGMNSIPWKHQRGGRTLKQARFWYYTTGVLLLCPCRKNSAVAYSKQGWLTLDSKQDRLEWEAAMLVLLCTVPGKLFCLLAPASSACTSPPVSFLMWRVYNPLTRARCLPLQQTHPGVHSRPIKETAKRS